mmetsp:Transcript_19865/g.26989  ORF Transcript_19865/g.26989 Transcript_19865/m.26989 type:complete len:195 (-) Transcript_19865:117-701(-)
MRISSIAFSRGSVIAQAALSIGAVLQHHHNAHCFFGKGKAQLDAEERQRQLDLEIKTLREQLEDAQKTLSQMPAAMEVLDRNHDGKIDAKDLAMLEDDLRVVIGKKVTAAVETGVPSQMGFGFISGWCSGFTLRRVGKVMAFGCGSVFILLQSLAYNGFIKIDMDMIEKKSMVRSKIGIREILHRTQAASEPII